MCLNASRSRDVEDAIPYMVGVFRKKAIPYIFIYGWTLINGGNVFERFAFAGCRGRHPLHFHIWVNIDKFGKVFERFAFTGCRGRHPLHGRCISQGRHPLLFHIWMNIDKIRMICLNASRSRDVGDAIPYKIDVFHKGVIFNVSYALRTLVNWGNVFERFAFTGCRRRHPLHGRCIMQGSHY